MLRKMTLLLAALVLLVCWGSLEKMAKSEEEPITSLSYDNLNLTSLDVSGYPALEYLSCMNNQLISLNVTHNPALEKLQCGRNQLTNLDVTHNPALNFLLCENNQLTSLAVTYNPALETLRCGYNQLTSLDVTHNPTLRWLLCEDNQLTGRLDVTHNPALARLDCDNNSLTSLDASNNPALADLNCENNSLTSLDVSNSSALSQLDCHNNSLSSLDVSNSPVLSRLDCSNNSLISLDVSHNLDLELLSCGDNQLTSLDVSNNPALTVLFCYRNRLISLDVAHCPALSRLSCHHNQLASLDVTHNRALYELSCENNQLTSLDVSHNPALYSLACYSNTLTSLDVSHNPALKLLYCWNCGRTIPAINNQFDLATLPGFVVSRASNWRGGTVEGTILTFEEDRVTYSYDCGNGFSAEFFLNMENPPLTATSTLCDGLPEARGAVVEQLYEDASGNYSWEPNAGEASKAMTLALEVVNNDPNSLITTFEVALSEGFSFSEDGTVSSKRLTMNNRRQTFYEPVYPINIEKLTEELVITVSKGYFEQPQAFPIEQRDQGSVVFAVQSLSDAFIETLDMDWNDELFDQYANRYSQKMAELCLYLSLSGQNTDMLRTSLESWRFEDLDWNTEEYSGLRSCIASRKIVQKDDPINLVVIVANQRNDYTWGDWILHSTLGEEAYLKPALYEADADRIVNRMFGYLVDHEMDFDNTAILVCGRNDGGAVANVITHRIHTAYNFLKVKGYTFAAPNVTASEPNNEANLYNYCYAHDAVTLIPKKFYKYGYTLYVGGTPGFPDSVGSEYARLTGRAYEKPGSRIITGLLLNVDEEKISLLGGLQNALASLFLQTQAAEVARKANAVENYLAWLKGNGRSGDMSLALLRQEFIVEEATIKAIQGANGVVTVANSAKTMVDPTKSGLKDTFDGLLELYNGVRDVCTNYVPELWDRAKKAVLSFFACPVDVTLYDGSWNVMTRFVNHDMVQESASNLARSWQDEDCDIIATPLSEDYVMRIVGNGEGTMDVATGVFDDDDNLTGNDAFQNIPVHNGATYLSGYLYDALGDGNWVSYVYADTDRLLYMNGSVYAEESFTLPAGLTELLEEAFAGDMRLGGLVVIPAGVTSIGSGAFTGTGVAVVVIEGGDTAISDDAFGGAKPILVCRAGSQPAEWAARRGFPCVKMPPL